MVGKRRQAPANPTEHVTKPHTLEIGRGAAAAFRARPPGEGTATQHTSRLEGSNDARTGMPPEYQGRNFLQGVSGSASGDTHRKTHPKASEEAACKRRLHSGRGTRSARPQRHPRRTGSTQMTIQLPHCSPQEPVRTQVDPARNRPCRRWQAAAYGPRVEVQTPRTRRRTAAPAGGSPGICKRRLASGQRSTDSIGAGDRERPRTSDTPATTGTPA
ncbi:Cytochrome P450 family protein [Aspergillus niger]|uniref:Cytochrome P450 family protein n=1 Tax=Aspergillus niger TaxID=5061 RepID=A0A505IUG8_ASPNG|nr:Cytochrome P450 family protein [Aspergillus niger]